MTNRPFEPLELRHSTHQDNSGCSDVRDEIGWRVLKAGDHCIHNDLNGFLGCRPHIDLSHLDRPWEAGFYISAADLHVQVIDDWKRSTETILQRIGADSADGQAVMGLKMTDDRLVHMVATDLHAPAVDDAAQRNHRDLGVSGADINHHLATGLGHWQTGSGCCSEGLLDQVNRPRARSLSEFPDCPTLHLGGPIRDAHRHTGPDPQPSSLDVHHLMTEQRFSHIEFCDQAVPNRSNHPHISRRPPQHGPCIFTHRHDAALSILTL